MEINSTQLIFTNPSYLYFLLSLPCLVILHYILLKYTRGRVLQFANFVAMSRIATPQLLPRNVVQLVIRLLTLTLIIFAVSGTYFIYLGESSEADYVLAIDVSSSMSASDLEPTRLEAAKTAALDLIDSLPAATGIGLVSFSGTAFVEQKVTEDRELLVEKISKLSLIMVGGTDIGEAMISSINLLLNSGKSKSVVLLTDGRSNIGVSVDKAIEYANDNSVTVHTIGVGTLEGGSPRGINITLQLDENLLRSVSEKTSGTYIYANNPKGIADAYKRLVISEKKKITVDLTIGLMVMALILSFLDWLLVNTKYRRIP